MKDLDIFQLINEISATKDGVEISTADNKVSYPFSKYSKISVRPSYLVQGEEVNPTPDPEPTPQPETDMGTKEYFDRMLAEFNGVLSVKVSETGSTSAVYQYLKSAYDKAWTEFSNPDSLLFSKDTYPDVYDYHGTNKQYYELSFASMSAWLNAMLLSELVPTSGVSTNNQTKLFSVAYTLGGGREIPIYGDFDMHSDPMLARLAAGAVYAMYRAGYTYSQVNAFRSALGGSLIPASDWDGLGYQGKDNGQGGMTKLGYLVNSDIIIPAAPGPYADGFSNRTKPYEQGQPRSQFCASPEYDWDVDNYRKDCDIDDYMVANYEMGAQTSDATWNSYSKDKKAHIIRQCSSSRATDNFFFGHKNVKFDGIHMGSRAGNYKDYRYFWFSETNETPTDTNEVYTVSGPFGDLYDKMFSGGGFGVKTDTLKFFNTVMDIADNARYPTFHNQYGRRRPCGGSSGTTGSARSPINGDKLNSTYNIDICCIFADSQAMVDKWSQEGGFVTEKPKSYPSGHTAMAWTVAYILGQMNPNTLVKYMRNAYELSVYRSLGRAHWNTDLIYGRLFATMTIPVINAMSGIQASYENAKTVINSGSDKKNLHVNIILKNYGSSSVTVDGDVKFYLANPDSVGHYYGWQGKYNAYPEDHLMLQSGKITVGAGKSVTFNNVELPDSKEWFGERSFAKDADVKAAHPKNTNVYLYVNGDGETVIPGAMPDNAPFIDGYTYTIGIGGTSSYSSSGGGGGDTSKPGQVITFTLNIKNNRSSSVTIDDKINYVLANPDRNGFYYGEVNGAPYTGVYNRWEVKPLGTGQKKCITIPAGGSKAFTMTPSASTAIFKSDKSLYGQNVTNGFGGRNLVTKEFVNGPSWNASRGKTNVLLYVDGDSNVIVPECLDSNMVFENGKTYTLYIN